MRVAQFSVVAFPKLSQERELLLLRERFAPDVSQLEPYITIVSPWVPVELGEIFGVVESISQTRRKLHPLAISCEGWQRLGEILVGEVTQGADELLRLRQSITGTETASLINETTGSGVYLVVCRVINPGDWDTVLKEAGKIGRSLGVIDGVVLIRTLPDGTWQRVADFPFGVGRVDFYERLSP